MQATDDLLQLRGIYTRTSESRGGKLESEQQARIQEQEERGPMFGRLRSAFRNSDQLKNQTPPPRKTAKTKQAGQRTWHLKYRTGERIMQKVQASTLALGLRSLTINVPGSTHLDSVIIFLPSCVFFTVLSPWLLFFGANTKM